MIFFLLFFDENHKSMQIKKNQNLRVIFETFYVAYCNLPFPLKGSQMDEKTTS